MAWIYYPIQVKTFLIFHRSLTVHNDKDKSFKNTNEEAKEMKILLLSTNELKRSGCGSGQKVGVGG